MEISKKDTFREIMDKGHSLSDAKKIDEAEMCYECAKEKISNNEERYEYLYSIADLFGEKGEYKKAHQYIDELIAEQPRYEDSYSLKAGFYWDQGLYKEAVKYYKKELVLQKDKHEIFYDIGHCYLMLKRFKLAQRYAKKCLVIKRKDIDCSWLMGEALLAQREYLDAIKYLKLAYHYNRKRYHCVYSYAKAFALAEQFEESLEIINRYLAKERIEETSNLNALLMLKATIHLDQKKYQEAEFILKDLEKNNYVDKDIYLFLGDIYYQLMDYKNSFFYYSKAEKYAELLPSIKTRKAKLSALIKQ